jgi:hypothetical protein
MLSLGKYLRTNPMLFFAILKRLVRKNLSLTLPVGLVAFHLAFGG